jgi:DNA-directed RNA polymerase specialized sigma24 family protein
MRPVKDVTIPNRSGENWSTGQGTRALPGTEDDRSFQLTLLRALLLPAPRRDVFLLKEIQGFTLPEVARLLGISRDDVIKHWRRARRDMQTS